MTTKIEQEKRVFEFQKIQEFYEQFKYRLIADISVVGIIICVWLLSVFTNVEINFIYVIAFGFFSLMLIDFINFGDYLYKVKNKRYYCENCGEKLN